MARPDEELAAVKDRGWWLLDPVDAAYASGEITQAEWHARMAGIVEPAYLAGADEREQSGHSGSQEDWEWSRSLVMAAIDRDGDVLDIGCANGLMMASFAQFGRIHGLRLEPYGVDISPALADLARRRLPQWADRIWVGNACEWVPPRRFDFVRTGLEYVPQDRRRAYVEHLLRHTVAPGGRLVVGKDNVEVGAPGRAEELTDLGFTVAGVARRDHTHPGVEMRVCWIDA